MSCTVYAIIGEVFFGISMLILIATAMYGVCDSDGKHVVLRCISGLALVLSCFSLSMNVNGHCKDAILSSSNHWQVDITNDKHLDEYQRKYILAAITILEFKADGNGWFITNDLKGFKKSCSVIPYDTDNLYKG